MEMVSSITKVLRSECFSSPPTNAAAPTTKSSRCTGSRTFLTMVNMSEKKKMRNLRTFLLVSVDYARGDAPARIAKKIIHRGEWK